MVALEDIFDKIAPFSFPKRQPGRSCSIYSFFRHGDANDDGWSNIKKLEYRDLETARRDIHGKSLPLFDYINSYDLFSIKAAFVFAEDAVNRAQSALESANRAIALANATAADALALHNAQTKAREDPAAHKEDVPMVDYERGSSSADALALHNAQTKATYEAPPAHKEDVPIVDYEREIKRFSEVARKALKYYKDTKDEEFELVEITRFETMLGFPYWITLVTFVAKPKDDMPDTCPRLFFAVLYVRGELLGEYEVKICEMCEALDLSGPDVIMDCGYVKHDMAHPKGVKFWAGPLSATPESDKASDMGSSSADAR